MNAQQLKNAIIQEAITGRLVPQDPNDEPASVLLDKIRKEKAKLVKEGKLKKKDLIETPISKEEIPFEIPESWEWCKLGNVIRLKSGECIKIRSLKNNSEYPIFGGNGINGSYDSYNVEAETLIIGRVGFYCGSVHKTSSKAWVTDNALIVTYNKAIFNIDYLQYALTGLNLRSTSNSTAQPVVSGKGIYPLIIPLPPLAEQHRIVAKIEELLPKVEEYGKAQEALDKLNAELPERLKKSILQEAITGKLVPQDPNDEPASVLLDKIRKEKAKLVKEGKLKKKDLIETPISKDEIPFEIPESWEWVRLGTITTVLGGKRIPAGRKLTQDNTGHIYIRVSDMKEETVSIDNLLYVPKDIFPSISRYIINKEDVYITVAGTIGKIGKIPSELDGANLTENADRLVFSNICQDWLIKSLQSAVIQSQIAEVTTKVGQPKLAILRIQNLIIPLPPLAEQHRIVAKIEELLTKIDKLKTKGIE
ncbi:MAG: restriction endonuclease subunit S [Prevotella sp.]|nr:restriction endonuclease subunit S [Prevotella sp.]